jgi:hypothetical protein
VYGAGFSRWIEWIEWRFSMKVGRRKKAEVDGGLTSFFPRSSIHLPVLPFRFFFWLLRHSLVLLADHYQVLSADRANTHPYPQTIPPPLAHESCQARPVIGRPGHHHLLPSCSALLLSSSSPCWSRSFSHCGRPSITIILSHASVSHTWFARRSFEGPQTQDEVSETLQGGCLLIVLTD